MRKFSPRNKLEVATLSHREIESADTLYEICNAEFNSRVDVHDSFGSAAGAKSWARYYLLHEVRKVAKRDNIYCSFHMAFIISKKLSQVWFAQTEPA